MKLISRRSLCECFGKSKEDSNEIAVPVIVDQEHQYIRLEKKNGTVVQFIPLDKENGTDDPKALATIVKAKLNRGGPFRQEKMDPVLTVFNDKLVLVQPPDVENISESNVQSKNEADEVMKSVFYDA